MVGEKDFEPLRHEWPKTNWLCLSLLSNYLLIMFITIVFHHQLAAEHFSYHVMDLPLLCWTAAHAEHRAENV